MRPNRLRRLAAGAVIVGALVPAGAGAATACDGTHHGDVRGVSATVRKDVRGHQLLAIASQYTGLTRDQIKAQLVSGKSLADIANGVTGKSAQGLVDAYMAAAKTKLDAAVAAGKITSAKETDLLNRMQPWIVRLVNFHWTHR